jgi:predicted deacetylase
MAQDRAVARLKSGFAAVEKSLGQKPSGFVPPLWLAPLRIVDAAKTIGLEYCVIANKVYSFTKPRVFTTAQYLVSEGSARTSFVDSVLELELGGAVQLGVHPLDYRSNKVFDILQDMKDRLGYRFTGYLDYLRSFS